MPRDGIRRTSPFEVRGQTDEDVGIVRRYSTQEISLSYEQQQHDEQAALILNRLKAPREAVNQEVS